MKGTCGNVSLKNQLMNTECQNQCNISWLLRYFFKIIDLINIKKKYCGVITHIFSSLVKLVLPRNCNYLPRLPRYPNNR